MKGRAKRVDGNEMQREQDQQMEKCEPLYIKKSQMQDLCQPEGQTDSLNPREQTSLYLAKQQVLCHVSQTSLTVHPTQDNTLCSLPTELINTGCRNVQKLISHGTNPCGTS